jgi:hypothetical protein
MEQAITPVTAGAGWITGKTTVANHSQLTVRKKAVPKNPRLVLMSKRTAHTTKIGILFHFAVSIINRQWARWKLAIQSLLCLQTLVKLVVKDIRIENIERSKLLTNST